MPSQEMGPVHEDGVAVSLAAGEVDPHFALLRLHLRDADVVRPSRGVAITAAVGSAARQQQQEGEQRESETAADEPHSSLAGKSGTPALIKCIHYCHIVSIFLPAKHDNNHRECS